MHKYALASIVVLLSVSLAPVTAETHYEVGVGAHYWRTLHDLDLDGVEEDGVAWYASLQIVPAALLRFEFDLEMLPEKFAGGRDNVVAPAAYVVVGTGIYGALGIGGYYSDGSFEDDPFYAVRAGLVIELLPSLHIDINANYRVNEWEAVRQIDENLDTDTITLGAAARLQF